MEENFEKTEEIKKDEGRLAILKKIEEYEMNGWFDRDLEDDPPTIPLKPNKVDYLNKKLSSKILSKFAFAIANKFLKKIIKEKQLIIDDIIGLENLKKLSTGAIITCNHFNPFDCFTVQHAYNQAKLKNKLFTVIREGNYTNFPGFYGMLMRHCNTMPLSQNSQTMKKFMKSMEVILKRGDFVCVYPEQSMWWNYKKPKPLKEGAFKFAINNEVPVVPIFITMKDSELIGPDGFPIQRYTVHISEPIYQQEGLDKKQNIKYMLDKNYEVWKEIYETTYGEKLTYITKE